MSTEKVKEIDNKSDWIELAKISQQNFFNRRELEWRLSFSYWGAIVAFTVTFFVEGGARFPDVLWAYLLVVPYIAIWVASGWTWQFYIQDAHATDKRFMIFYVRRMTWETPPEKPEDVTDVGQPPVHMRKMFCCKDFCSARNQWYIAHLLVSFVLFSLSWVAILLLHVENKGEDKGLKGVEFLWRFITET